VPTPVKLLLWLLTGIAALCVLLVSLLFFVDVNLYRDRIEQHVSTAFGRDVILQGPLSLEPSLTPRFVVNGLKITNPDWASRPFLATVDKFDIRVNLLPLLRGDLEVVSLEFHGVDLLLEKTAEGANNFTFASSGENAAPPAIEHLSLNDAMIAYAGPDGPVKRLHMARVTARKVPGQPLELEAHTAVNAIPITLALHGEAQDNGQPDGPWQLTLSGTIGDLSLQIEGRIAQPTDWRYGEYRLDLKGRHLDDLETVSGYPLPEAEPVALGANIRFNLDEFIELDDITGHVGSSDLQGSLRLELSDPRPAIRLRLESQQLSTSDMEIDEPETPGPDEAGQLPDNPVPDIGALAGTDLDIEIRVQQFTAADNTLNDILLIAHADQKQLGMALDNATVNNTHITAKATLPWGDSLTALAPESVGLDTLLHHAVLEIQAEAPDAVFHHSLDIMDDPLDVVLTSVQASVKPGSALTVQGVATLNGKPHTVTLQGEPLAALAQRPTGPWQNMSVEVRGEAIRLDAGGSVARPLEARGFDVSYALSGPDIGMLLPLDGAWSITGHYADQPDRHVFDTLKVMLGGSDIDGRIVLHPGGPRPRLVANLDADLIDINALMRGNAGQTKTGDGLDKPLYLDGLVAIDLDVELGVRQLKGLARPVQDMLLTARGRGQRLALTPARATVEGVQLDARAELPWGERLAALGKNGISVRQLVQHADLAIQAKAPAGKLQHEIALMGHQMNLELAEVEAVVPPGKALELSASARLQDTPVQISLQAAPLAELLRRPEGPWQDLALEIRGGDIHLQASGRVDRPFEARGFDIRYALQGAEIETLLPIFNFVLSLEGAYSLTGHFADQPDRTVFDQLKISAGQSDISGNISVYPGEQRPRLIANFFSEQIYLRELLPLREPKVANETNRRVIPDYNLPVERMREIDGELNFSGERLRTAAGDLGDIHFTATLQDGIFRIEPFRVRGWAGALIESDATINASQDPPRIDWQWVARQLNYGVLLQQARFPRTVEGTLDITLRLSGKGRTRHEFLGDVDGQFVIVGRQGRLGSRWLDLWGSDLVTTMLSREWRRGDVTDLNCMAARVTIEDGLASIDAMLVDTRRITIGAAGTLNLENETLNLVISPRPKRTSLVSLTNPVHVTGTMAAPRVAVTVLPRRQVMAAAGTGLLAGLVHPGYLIFTFTQTGSGVRNPCAAAVNEAMIMKGRAEELDDVPAESSPPRFSLFPGCTRSGQRRE
jgi:uncharacterized protein involved in outer membrane biogenesis